MEEGKKYRQCLKPFPAQIFNIIFNNMKKTHKDFCETEETKRMAFYHLQCLTPETKPEFVTVANLIVSMMTYVSKLDDLNEAIPSMCCGIKMLIPTAYEAMEKTCTAVGRKASGKWLTNLVAGTMDDAMDIMCGAYPTLQDCAKKVPHVIPRIRASFDPNHNGTILIPFVRLIKRMDKQLTAV